MLIIEPEMFTMPDALMSTMAPLSASDADASTVIEGALIVTDWLDSTVTAWVALSLYAPEKSPV